MRLDRRLCELAFGTRKEVQALIRQGLVTVGGQTVRDPGQHTDDAVVITVKGTAVDTRRIRHLIMNKPAGVLTAARDARQQTVMDLLPPVYGTLSCMPVGRLDRDTTGLLFFTSDGELNHRLLSPQRHVDQTYRAQVDADLTQEDVERFAQGMDLGDFVTETAELVLEGPRTGLVTIHEGKFHQVKRMFEAVGKQVLLLDRLSFGPLKLPKDLPRGTWRELNREEIQSLYRQVGMEEPV